MAEGRARFVSACRSLNLVLIMIVGDFQLITWSKDRTLRFWPMDSEIMQVSTHAHSRILLLTSLFLHQKVGHVQEPNRGRARIRSDRDHETSISFRNPPDGTEYLPALSAPIGHRSILAEVRAPLPPRHHILPLHAALSAGMRDPAEVAGRPVSSSGTKSRVLLVNARSQGGTMSRGNNGGKSVARMDAFQWLSSVKVGTVGERRGSSSGPPSGADSADVSRLNSRSRPPSGPDLSGVERQLSDAARHKKSESQTRGGDERREGEPSQSLQDE